MDPETELPVQGDWTFSGPKVIVGDVPETRSGYSVQSYRTAFAAALNIPTPSTGVTVASEMGRLPYVPT